MNNDEHDPLWTLLGKARQPKVSPFFAGNVLRAVREAEEPRPGILEWLRRKWYVPVAAGACAAVLAFFAMRPTSGSGVQVAAVDPLEEIAIVAVASQEVIPSLDTLLASGEQSIWLAGDPSSLY
jgi:hypothetical protein